jgi:hypothetical protein
MVSLCRAGQFAFAPARPRADIGERREGFEIATGWAPTGRTIAMQKDTYRIVTRGADGQIRIRDYDSAEALLKRHSQVGVDDCSTDLSVRGLPVFRGLIGPIPEGKNVIRYESPEVFETLTKEWSTVRPSRRRSRSRTQPC